MKSYNKSNKNRNQVVYKIFDNCNKLTYTVKGKPHTFYKNFWFNLDHEKWVGSKKYLVHNMD